MVPPLSELPPALDSNGQEPPRIVVEPPGPMSRALAAKLAAVECPAFDARRDARAVESGADHAPIVYASARGSNVIDADGNRYVDLAAGFGALLLGHSPKRVARAIEAQMERTWLALGDVYSADVKIALCERLAKLFPEPGARVMLGLSGADAVTAAMKTATLATGRPGVVAFYGGYHGLSVRTARGLRSQRGVPRPVRGPARRRASSSSRTRRTKRRSIRSDGSSARRSIAGASAAFSSSPCSVAAGASFLRQAFWECSARRATRPVRCSWPTRFGRGSADRGAMLASTDAGVVPDVVCLGKGLGGGFPISACIGRGRALRGLGCTRRDRDPHGDALRRTARVRRGLATLDAIASEKLPMRAKEVGDRWVEALAISSATSGSSRCAVADS